MGCRLQLLVEAQTNSESDVHRVIVELQKGVAERPEHLPEDQGNNFLLVVVDLEVPEVPKNQLHCEEYQMSVPDPQPLPPLKDLQLHLLVAVSSLYALSLQEQLAQPDCRPLAQNWKLHGFEGLPKSAVRGMKLSLNLSSCLLGMKGL